MKKNILFSAILLCAFFLKNSFVTAHEWKEKEEFHKVMAATFHPSEEGNFEPIRARVQEMYDKAEAWAKSTPPAVYNKPEIKATLKDLVAGVGELKTMIEKKATNEELKPKLEALHETFHKIVGLCSHEGENKHDEYKGKK